MGRTDASRRNLGRARSAAGLACLSIALVAMACSFGSTAPDARAVAPAEDAAPTEIRTVAFASVRVTDEEATGPLVDRVVISPASIVLDPGDVIRLSARALDEDSGEVSDVDFVWSVPDARVGTMLRNGWFRAGRTSGVFPKSISVTAIQNAPDGVHYSSAQSTVTVISDTPVARLARVEIFPERPTILPHQIFRVRAIGLDNNGMVIHGVGFTWKLNDPGLGRINDIGLLTVDGADGTYEGGISVTAEWDGVEAFAETDVVIASTREADDFLNVHALPQRFSLEPGDRIQLRAVALNGLGKIEAGTQLRWEMVDGTAGTIDGGGQFIAGDTPGVYAEAVRVEAIVPGEQGFVRAHDFASVVIRRVGGRRLHTLDAHPVAVVTRPGARSTILVGARDSKKKPADDIAFTWEVLNKDAGEVNETGGFTAGPNPGIYPGAVRVTARQIFEGEIIERVDVVHVLITGTLTRTDLQPAVAVIAPGRTVHFSLSGWDENDLLLYGLVVLWSVTDDRAGSIDILGTFRVGDVPGTYPNAIRAEVVQRLP